MPNPRGVNGWGKKDYPPKDELRAYLLNLAKHSLTVPERLVRMEMDLGIRIGRSKFFELQKHLDIPSIRKPGLTLEEIDKAVLTEIEADVNQRRGPVAIKEILKNKSLVLVPRERIRAIMQHYAPEGFDHHLPGNTRRKIIRKPLTSIGPFREICADGHEKLNQQALDMGNLSIPIYAYRDKWSGFILKLSAIPNVWQVGAIGHVYLDLIQEWDGIPVQLTTDKGSEIGWQVTIQSILREFYAPHIDLETYPPALAIPSTRNTVIEGFWRWLREKSGHNLKDIIIHGKLEQHFQVHDQRHHDLFYWIFLPLIQHKLDSFCDYWNNHKIQKQLTKAMPSGHIPADALHHPSLFQGHKCLIRIPEDAQIEMHNILTEEVRPPEEHLSWYSTDFHVEALTTYKALGSPHLSLANAWEIFTELAHQLAF